MDDEGDIKVEKKQLNTLIIHPAIEPGVIDNAMIIRCILEYGPKEEAGRLFAEEGVHIDEAPTVRLEFQNILRIDHLWMLTSLTKLTLAHNYIEKIENLELLINLNELDLSFNKIEIIENIEKLVKIEVFTLFHNRIRKLQNMDTLEKLLVFSIGDNLIEDYKEVAYMRRFRMLRSFSFQGNPCCDDPNTKHFLSAALPKVTFLNYKIIKDEHRTKGGNIFRSLLRQLDAEDEIKEKQRLAKEEYDAQVAFYAMSFVEYLSGPELLISMMKSDPDGSILFSLGGELIAYFEEYKEQYVAEMSRLVEFAQEAYIDRQNEIKLFEDLVGNALLDSVAKSKVEVDKYEQKKIVLMAQAKALIAKYTAKQATLDDIEPKLVAMTEEFNDALYDVWKSLMTYEMQLYEQCEESRVQFGVNMEDKMTKLQEQSRNAFGVWRELDGLWCMRQFETVSKYIGTTASKTLMLDPCPELVEALKDRDMVMNLVAQSSDNHLRFIDAREDVLTTRSNDWAEDVMIGANDKEVRRNRARIMEINYYVDNQRLEWQDLQMSVTEPVDLDAAAALLGDDF